MPRSGMRSRLLTSSLCLIATLGQTALAQDPPETPPAAEASIDVARGPITGGPRLLGLGGAFVAIAAGTDGIVSNPASVAVRTPYSWSEWDYDLGFDVGIGAWLPETEFFSAATEEVRQTSSFFGSLAFLIQKAHTGVGASLGGQRHALSRGATQAGLSPADLSANYGMVHLSLAHGFLGGQLLFGIGPRMTGVSFDASSSPADLVSVTGVGLQLGAIVKPARARFRLGAAFKSSIAPPASEDANSGPSARSVHVPWEVVAGGAYQFGPRPLSPELQIVPEDDPAAQAEQLARYRSRDRRYLLVSAQLRVLEPPTDRVDLIQYWQGVLLPSDGQLHMSPSLGFEGEAIPHWLKLRLGSYYEPALGSNAGRVHGTLGFDIKMFPWSVFGLVEPFDFWTLSVGADAARSYLNTTFSLGLWH